MKQQIWFIFLVSIIVFGGCGALSTPRTLDAAPQKAIRYHAIDNTTTTFTPYVNVVCFYVESMKLPPIITNENATNETRTPPVYTSGLSCVVFSKSEYDTYVDKYPTP